MVEQNKALIRTWFKEVWDGRSPAAIDRYFAPDSHRFGIADHAVDLAGYKSFHQQMLDAFADIRVTLDDLIAEDDRVAVRWTTRMTHTGSWQGIPPTGRLVVLPGSSHARIANGQIVEAWNFMDMTAITQTLQQIAAAPAAE